MNGFFDWLNTYVGNVGLLDSFRLIASNKYLNVIELNFGKKCKMQNFTGYDVILSDYLFRVLSVYYLNIKWRENQTESEFSK